MCRRNRVWMTRSRSGRGGTPAVQQARRLAAAALMQQFIAEAPVVLVIAADYDRTTRRHSLTRMDKRCPLNTIAEHSCAGRLPVLQLTFPTDGTAGRRTRHAQAAAGVVRRRVFAKRPACVDATSSACPGRPASTLSARGRRGDRGFLHRHAVRTSLHR